MVSSTLYIQDVPDALVVRLIKKGNVDGFHSFMTAILVLGLLMLISFIYSTITADGVVAIQSLFVAVGVYGLFSLHQRLRGLWLFIAGRDILEVKEGLFTFSSSFGIWKRHVVLRVADIQGIELVQNPYPSIFTAGGPLPGTDAQVMKIWRSKKVYCCFGQFLGVVELAELYDVLSKRLRPLMQVVS